MARTRDGRGETRNVTGQGQPGTPHPNHDQVNSPAHYKGSGSFEAIDVIESFGLGYRLGNVVKYVLRADKKGKRLQDLKKAAWYLAREISKTEGSA